jgi:hypothetical protein
MTNKRVCDMCNQGDTDNNVVATEWSHTINDIEIITTYNNKKGDRLDVCKKCHLKMVIERANILKAQIVVNTL